MMRMTDSYLPGERPPVLPDVRAAGPDRKNRDPISPARTDGFPPGGRNAGNGP
jgi:hypothetical protein